MNRWFYLGLGTAIGLIAVVGLMLFRPYTLHGLPIDTPKTAPEIALTSAGGQPFRLSAQKGKIVLIFFGYTSCADVCPTTMAQMKQVRQDLGKQANQVEFVFVTVDPSRDTPQQITSFLDKFDPTFIGIPGTKAQLEPIWKDYGVAVGIPAGQNMSGNYTVTHSSYIYLIDQQGRMRLLYDYGTPSTYIEQDIRYLLRNG